MLLGFIAVGFDSFIIPGFFAVFIAGLIVFMAGLGLAMWLVAMWLVAMWLVAMWLGAAAAARVAAATRARVISACFMPLVRAPAPAWMKQATLGREGQGAGVPKP